MTYADKTDPSQSESLTFEVDLRHPPQKVWRALTDPELLAEWLLPVTGLKLERGAAFTLHGPELPGWDGKVHCKMLEVQEKQKLAYSWDVGDALRTVVTFSITATATGTRLVIVQSGFTAAQKQNWGGARYGWRMMSEKLLAVLDRA